MKEMIDLLAEALERQMAGSRTARDAARGELNSTTLRRHHLQRLVLLLLRKATAAATSPLRAESGGS